MFKFGQPVKLWTGEIVLYINSNKKETKVMGRFGKFYHVPTFYSGEVVRNRKYLPVEDTKLNTVVIPRFSNESLNGEVSEKLKEEMVLFLEKCIEKQVNGAIR